MQKKYCLSMLDADWCDTNGRADVVVLRNDVNNVLYTMANKKLIKLHFLPLLYKK